MMSGRTDITGLVLAGGRGQRMGGIDKGLQPFRGRPLAQHAIERLRPQVGPLLVNANRHADAYAAFDAPVCADPLPGFAGPLAGFAAGLVRCDTPWLVTVPCDTPLFPADLVARLAQAAQAQRADLAMAVAPESDGALRAQPVFCLLRRELLPSLLRFLADGGRKIDTWTGGERTAQAVFDQPGDHPRAFFNANTLDELHALERAT